LYIQLQIDDFRYPAYPDFGQSGIDICTRIFIMEDLALIGGYVHVKMMPLDDTVLVRIPRRTEDGQILHIPECGLYSDNDDLKRGNAYIKVTVVSKILPPVESPHIQMKATPFPQDVNSELKENGSEDIPDSVVMDQVQLCNEMKSLFNLNEIKALCFELHLDAEEVDILDKTTGTINLIQYCNRRNRLDELINLCKSKRPEGKW
jgi:DnaJ-class molecular chaperone